jgi:hypothetical protein
MSVSRISIMTLLIKVLVDDLPPAYERFGTLAARSP